MKTISLGQGVAPVVSWQPGSWYVAIGHIGRVVVVSVSPDGVNRGVFRSYPDGFGFPSLFGEWLAYKSSDATGSLARLWNLRDGRDWSFQPAAGNFPVVLSASHFAWQIAGLDGYSVFRLPLANPDTEPTYVGQGAPDGLAWIDAAGSVALIKDVNNSVAGMKNPQRASVVTVGEQEDIGGNNWPLGMSVGYRPKGSTWRGWLLPGQICNTPRVAAAADLQQFAVVTWGESVRVQLLDLADIEGLPPPPIMAPGPVPTPIPPPIPTPEPIAMKLPDLVKSIRSRYVAKFPIPQTPGGGAEHEERCRQWSIRFAQQVAFDLPNQGWGVKRASGPISKDTIALQTGGRLFVWDLLVGTGTGTPTLNEDPDGEQVFGQMFVPVDPLDSLGGATPIPGSGPTPQPPSGVHQVPEDWVNLEHWQNVEIQQIAAWYFEKHRQHMGLSDWAFQSYRRLGPELWTMQRIQREI
jgi:hypothetical protein